MPVHAYLKRDDFKEQLGALVVQGLRAIGIQAHQRLLLDGAHRSQRADGRGALK